MVAFLVFKMINLIYCSSFSNPQDEILSCYSLTGSFLASKVIAAVNFLLSVKNQILCCN